MPAPGQDSGSGFSGTQGQIDARVLGEAAEKADKKVVAKVEKEAQEAVREEIEESRPEVNGETEAELLKRKSDAIAAKKKKRQTASDAEPMDFSEFWKDDSGEALMPMYPFKPFVKIRFLSKVRAVEIEAVEGAEPPKPNQRQLKLEYDDIYEVPFNYLTNFTITTHPHARAQITISDTEFKNIENFSMRALALYNETIRKIQKGYWGMSAMEIPSFCQLTWGYIGKDVDRRVESSVLSFILLGFKYSIGQTWLTINLDLVGNSQYFFSVTKFATGKLGKIRPTEDAKDEDEFEIYRFIETALKRFGLENWRHYALGPTTGVKAGTNEFIRKISVQQFNLRLANALKSGASVADFVQKACEMQLEDGSYLGLPKEEQPMGVTVITARPDNPNDFERYGLIKRWILKPGPSARDDKASRVYEWKRSPTSVITQMSADIPDGYFLGYTSLSFLGYTLDDDGQIAMHVVQVGADGDVRTIDELESVDIPEEQMEYLREAKEANRLQDDIQKLEDKLYTTQQEAKAIEDLDEYKKLKKAATKGDDGVWRFTGTKDEAEEMTKWDKDLGKISKNLAAWNKQLAEARAEARTYIARSFHEFITNPANSQYIPIDLSPGGANGDKVQTQAEQDKFLSRNLLNTIADDMVATLNMTILGDPWLDGVHIDLVNTRVRIIVNRPDNEPSILSNDYFFMFNELRHTINSSGYTTSFTLKTAHDFIERAGELQRVHGGE